MNLRKRLEPSQLAGFLAREAQESSFASADSRVVCGARPIFGRFFSRSGVEVGRRFWSPDSCLEGRETRGLVAARKWLNANVLPLGHVHAESVSTSILA